MRRCRRRRLRTHFELVAAALNKALDDFVAAVPEFEHPHESMMELVRKKRGVPREFVSHAVVSLLVSSDLQSIRQLDAGAARNDVQYLMALRSVLMHLQQVETGLKFTMDAKEARLKATAQRIYAMGKALLRDRHGGELAVYVDKMKRALRPRRKSRNEEPEPAPVPPGTDVEEE